MLDELTTGLDPQARRDTWELIERVRDRGVTIVLVTHSMEEAERLCDRVALIDSGRLVVLDTPAALTEKVETGQRIQFCPSEPLDDALLTSLPDVTGVVRRGDLVVVTGNSNALAAVTSVLARHQIVARQLRVEQVSLEDVFLALTDIYVPIVILMSMALLALGVPAVLTGYREKGVLRRLQATPAGAARVLAAQLLVNLILVVISVMLVLAVARLGYGVALPRQLAGFALSVLLTLAALLGLGLFIAAIAPSTRGSQVIGGLLFYPMLFFSGLWFPIPLMAPALQHIAHAKWFRWE